MDDGTVTKRRRKPEVIAHKGFSIPAYTNTDSDSDNEDASVPQKRFAKSNENPDLSIANTSPMKPEGENIQTESQKTQPHANAKMKLVMDLFRKHHQKRGFNYFGHSVIEEIRHATSGEQPLLEMAVAIEGASQVYSYRVEATVMTCKETHDVCIGSKPKVIPDAEIEINEKGEVRVDEQVTKKKRKKVDDSETTDNYQARMANLWDNIGKQQGPVNTEEAVAKVDPDSDGSGSETESDDAETGEAESYLSEHKGWNGKINVGEKITAEREERLLNLDDHKLVESNPKLISDTSSLRVRRKENRQNSYYSAAIYNKNCGYSHRIFTMNCLRTPDARKLILHPRSISNDNEMTAGYHKPYPKEFLDSIAGLCDNALSDKPQSYGYFFPKTIVNTKERVLGVGGEEEDYLLEQDELEDVVINNREDDSTVMPDRTLMEGTMANRTMAFGGSAGSRRVTLKGLGEKQIRMPDFLDSFAGASINPKLSMTLAEIVNDLIAQRRKSCVGIKALEFNLNNDLNKGLEIIQDETRCVRLFGLGPIIAQLEASWHAEYVQMTITRQDYEDQINAINDLPAEKKEIAQKSILLPGRYRLFAAPPDLPCNYPRDPASNASLLEEADHLHVTTEMSATFSALHDPFNDSGEGDIMGIDGDLDYEPAPIPTLDTLAENMAANEVAKDLRIPIDDQEAACEVEAPQNEIMPDLDLLKIGKIDDAHWNKKAAKEKNEKDERNRKEIREERKQEREQLKKSFDLHFNDFTTLNESLSTRFQKFPDTATLEKNYLMSQAQIKQQIKNRLSESHKVQDLYDYNRFMLPRFLNRGRFGHCEIKRIAVPDKALRKLPRFPGMDDDDNECEDESTPPEGPDAAAYIHWMASFSLYYDDSVMSTSPNKDQLDSQAENNEGGPCYSAAPVDFEDDDAGFEFDPPIEGPDRPLIPLKPRKNPFTFEQARMMEDNEEPAHEIETDKEAMNEEDAKLLEQMLELARGAKQQRVDTLQIKLAIKQLLGNQNLDDGRLKGVAKNLGFLKKNKDSIDNRFTTPGGSSDKENEEMDVDKANLEDIDPEANTDGCLDEGMEDVGTKDKIMEALTAPPVDLDSSQFDEVERISNDDGIDANDVSFRVTNFDVEGEHSFSSLVSMLPMRLPAHEREIHVATTLVIALHMCNENGLICEQRRSTSDGIDASPWMSDFVFRSRDSE